MALAKRAYDIAAARELEMVRCRVLDAEHEAPFENIVYTAAQLFDVPICVISFISGERQWSKARVGLGAQQPDRTYPFCDETIGGDAPLVVADAARDPRFASLALVTGAPRIRFYAGTPVHGPGNLPLGALSVLDTRPRHFHADKMRLLTMLGAQVSELLCARAAAAAFPGARH